MSRAIVFVFAAILGMAMATPAVVRSKKDIEDFATFLENIRKGNSGLVTENTGLVQGRSTMVSTVENPEVLSGRFQGDIVLDDEDIETMLQEFSIGRSAYTTSSITTWPDNVVVFELGTGEFDAAQTAAIWAAITDIEQHTCVRFRQRTASDTVYVRVTGVTDGCYSHIGYRASRGEHTMNVGRDTVGVGCFRHATIVHEWMHILGFVHMHATPERDQFIKVEEENISEGQEHNFDIYSTSRINDYDVPYDYVSCMHYGTTSFSKNGLPTILPKQSTAGEMGQRIFIPDTDWLRINRHYSCPGAWN